MINSPILVDGFGFHESLTSFHGGHLVPAIQPMRCFALRVDVLPNGDIDINSVEWFLNNAIGPDQWLMTTEWLFSEPPDLEQHGPTVPVLVPEEVAVRLVLTDLEGPIQRVVSDHPVVGVEARRWRWAAFVTEPNDEGQGRFPWQRAHA